MADATTRAASPASGLTATAPQKKSEGALDKSYVLIHTPGGDYTASGWMILIAVVLACVVASNLGGSK